MYTWSIYTDLNICMCEHLCVRVDMSVSLCLGTLLCVSYTLILGIEKKAQTDLQMGCTAEIHLTTSHSEGSGSRDRQRYRMNTLAKAAHT